MLCFNKRRILWINKFNNVALIFIITEAETELIQGRALNIYFIKIFTHSFPMILIWILQDYYVIKIQSFFPALLISHLRQLPYYTCRQLLNSTVSNNLIVQLSLWVYLVYLIQKNFQLICIHFCCCATSTICHLPLFFCIFFSEINWLISLCLFFHFNI